VGDGPGNNFLLLIANDLQLLFSFRTAIRHDDKEYVVFPFCSFDRLVNPDGATPRIRNRILRRIKGHEDVGDNNVIGELQASSPDKTFHLSGIRFCFKKGLSTDE